MGDHRGTGLVEQVTRTIEDRLRLMVLAQEKAKCLLQRPLLKIINYLRTVSQQSLKFSPFEAFFRMKSKHNVTQSSKTFTFK